MYFDPVLNEQLTNNTNTHTQRFECAQPQPIVLCTVAVERRFFSSKYGGLWFRDKVSFELKDVISSCIKVLAVIFCPYATWVACELLM